MKGSPFEEKSALWISLIRKSLLLWVTCILIFMSGCWDLRYMDKLGVVMAMGIDKDPAGKQNMQVTVQVVLTQQMAAQGKGGGAGQSPVTTFTETGDTLFEAIRKMTSHTSRRLFFSHTQLLLISEAKAREGILPLLDLIERNPDVRTNISVLITRNVDTKEMLELSTQMESIPTTQILDTLEVNQESYAMIYDVPVKDLLKLAGRGQKQAALPSIQMEGDREMSNTQDNLSTIPAKAAPVLKTMAIFRDGKLVDYMNTKESRGLSWLQGKVQSTVVKVACPKSDDYLSIEIKSANNRYKVKRDPDGMPIIEATLKLTGNLQEITCPGIDVDDETFMNGIGDLVDQVVKAEAEAAIKKLQKKAKSDVLGWGKEVYMKQPNIWKRLEPDWTTVFPNVKYELTCTTKIIGTGIRSKSIVK